MKQNFAKTDECSSVILEALAKLDPKGTDESITRAMVIVFEAFRLNAASKPFSSEDILAAAISQQLET